MKARYKILISLFIVIFIAYHPVKRMFEDIDYKIKFRAYSSDSVSSFIYRSLRFIPKKYLHRYELKIEKYDNHFVLYRVDDLIKGVPKYSYYTYQKSNGTIRTLMGHDLILNAYNKGLIKGDDYHKYYDFLVDIDLFNEVFQECNKDTRILEYCNLFKTSEDLSTFRIIQNISDIDSILNYRPKSKGMTILIQDLEIEDYSFLDSIKTNEIVVWHFDSGITSLEFDFDQNDNIISIDREFKGYIGNEIRHL